MGDNYQCFAELAKENIPNIDYKISTNERHHSRVLIIAPHGGSIERRTSEIATALAGEDHSLYLFEGLDPEGSFDTLHITSHRFDEPCCVGLVKKFPWVISVHGCTGEKEEVFLGGLDHRLRKLFFESLTLAGLNVSNDDHKFQGTHPMNICNRGSSAKGVQIEFSDGLRGSYKEIAAIESLRKTLNVYCR